ncbi:hypothetical protein Plhal304r1_c013g0048511 [Plasmopara halstedii]
MRREIEAFTVYIKYIRQAHRNNKRGVEDLIILSTVPSFLSHFLRSYAWFRSTSDISNDRSFRFFEAQQYTVGEYVEEMTKRVGSFDSVVLWSGNPNSGIDNWNQQDFCKTCWVKLRSQGVIADFLRHKINDMLVTIVVRKSV